MTSEEIFKNFYNQRFSKEYVLLISVTNSTFRAFHKNKTYKKNTPSLIFRSWMNKNLDQLNKLEKKNFNEIYQSCFKSLELYWLKKGGINLNTDKLRYLLYKLIDLFFKHALLYSKLSSRLKKKIAEKTMPPLDSFTLLAIKGKDRVLYAQNESKILNAIPSNPSMGNTPKNGSSYNSNYLEFRKDCHQFFIKWAKINSTFPLCYDLYAWQNNTGSLKILD